MKPRCLALMGLPGAGKSTLAVALSTHLGWPVVSRDVLRAQGGWGYGDPDKAALNRRTFEQIVLTLRGGQSVLLDGMTFARSADRLLLKECVADAGGELRWIWLDLPVAIAEQRVEGAVHPARDRSAALVREVASRFVPVDAHILRLDALQSVERLVQQVLEAL